ncbi:DUF397 domain-containing protein [Glycomyces sp. NPDC048151]|uniref:DUF397 domain-containing protein n=1 Tax=Glycomyces sp. NPDC048151 TaxID=3364002 RepID=UPI00371619F5
MTRSLSIAWRKSTRSTNGDTCVEVRPSEGGFEIRDSKLSAASPILPLPRAEFNEFLAHAEASPLRAGLPGEFNAGEARWYRVAALEVGYAANGMVALRLADQAADDILVYTADEWNAFAEGARLGEFAPETWSAELVAA